MSVTPNKFLQARMREESNFDVEFWTLMYERLNKNRGALDIKNRTMQFPESVTPKKEKLWNRYKDLTRKRGLRANYATFLENYSKLKQTEDDKFVAYLDKARQFGFTDKMIRKNIESSPEILQKLEQLYGKAQSMAAAGDNQGINLQSSLNDILYNRSYTQTFMEDYAPYAAYAIGGGAGAYGLYKAYQKYPEIKNAPKDLIKKTKEKFGLAKPTPKTTAVTPYGTKPAIGLPKTSKGIMKFMKGFGKQFVKKAPYIGLGLTASELLSSNEE